MMCYGKGNTIFTWYFLFLFNVFKCQWKLKEKEVSLTIFCLLCWSPFPYSFPNYMQLQGSLSFFAFDIIFPSIYYLVDISSSFEHETPIFFLPLLPYCTTLMPHYNGYFVFLQFRIFSLHRLPLKSILKSQSLIKLQNVWLLPISFIYL